MTSQGTETSHAVSGDERLAAAFRAEEYRGLQLALRVRVAAVAVIAVWITIENDFPAVLVYYGVLLTFILLGVAPLALWKAGRYAPWHRYLFPLLDVSLLTLAAVMPNPLRVEFLTAPMRLRLGNEMYLFLLLMAATFTYSPRVVLWTGFSAAAVWSLATVAVLRLPGSVSGIPWETWNSLSLEQQRLFVSAPSYVSTDVLVRQVVVLLVVTAGLAAFVWRSRRLVLRQAQIERERTNLSRYFSPNMIDALAQSDEPLRTTRRQDIAVLFADVVGFTRMSESQRPEAAIEMLREFHRRMERLVFEHGGTLDKYIGDGVMVTFGTPHAGEGDATHALQCALAMIRSIEEWNGERAQRGRAAIGIGIGIHYGPVVMGDIGGAQRLEFAVIGDTVNVASRLERATRELSTPLIASGDLIEAVRHEGADADALLSALVEAPAIKVRGRDASLRAWTLRAG